MIVYGRAVGGDSGSEGKIVMATLSHFSVLRCESPFPLVKSELVLNCAVEQRLARQAHNLEVVGSIPTGATCSSSFSPHPIHGRIASQ